MTSTRAYRLLPLDAGGRPRESSQHTYVADAEIHVGDVLDAALGAAGWEVVEVRSGAGPLLAAKDASGREIPLAGTIVCRSVAPP